MLRSVTLGLALSILAAACALFERPVPTPPAGTFMLEVEVRNMSSEPVPLAVFSGAGLLPGAVQPASVPAHAVTNVTFYIPLTENGSILVDSRLSIPRTEVIRPNILREGCTLGIEVAADEGITYGCGLFP